MSSHDDEILGKAYDPRLMRRVWSFARPHRRIIFLSMALFPLIAALELLQPWLTKIAIDRYILPGDWVGLTWVAAAYLACLLGLYALRVAVSYLTQLAGQRVMHDLRAALCAHLQRQDAAFMDRNPVGRLMTRLLNDVEAINELFASGAAAVVGDVLTLAGIVVLMLVLNWELALVTFALVPVLAVGAAYFRLKARDSYRGVRIRLARLNAFLQYVGRFFLPIRDLGAKYTVMQAATVSAERIFALLDAEPAVRPPTAGAGGFQTGAPAVEFRNVWFAYEGEEWVLRDCPFEVAPGERVALVGPTGEGKSTIVRLMTRAYDVTRGQVLVGGRDVRQWDLVALRRAVAVIPQEVFLFTGTVEENLRVTSGGPPASRASIDPALQTARPDPVVASLPPRLA